MMMSLTSDVTTAPNAAPIMTPTARSRTLPRIANSLNSLNMVSPANDLSNSVLCLQKFEQRFIKRIGRFEVRNVADAGQNETDSSYRHPQAPPKLRPMIPPASENWPRMARMTQIQASSQSAANKSTSSGGYDNKPRRREEYETENLGKAPWA